MNKKIITLVLMLVFSLGVFTACSDKNTDVTTDVTSSEETEASETKDEKETKKTSEKEKTTVADKKDEKTEEDASETEKVAAAEETTKKSKKKKTTESTTAQAEDVILVTYSEETDDGEYKISLVRTAKGDYVLETADGTFPSEEGAYKGCLNSFYAFDMESEKTTEGQHYVHILLEDGSCADVYDSSEDSIGDGFLSIRNILIAFDENAVVNEAPADAAG